MTNLDSILKSRGITLSTKVHLVKAMVFPVVMYGCESWTIKKAERRRIDVFELWRLRRLLRLGLKKTLLDYKEIQPVHPKGDQSWVFTGRTDVEAETPVLLLGKSHGLRSLVGYSPWGHKELDMTEQPKSLQMVIAAMKLKDAYSLDRKL